MKASSVLVSSIGAIAFIYSGITYRNTWVKFQPDSWETLAKMPDNSVKFVNGEFLVQRKNRP